MDFNSVVCEYYERKQQTQQGWCHEDKNDNTPWHAMRYYYKVLRMKF